MHLPRALNTSLTSTFLAALFLFTTGIALAMVEVESRSQPSSWQGQEGAYQQNAGLDAAKKMEFLQQEVQELRGKVEEQAYQLQQLQEHQKKLYLDLDRRLREGGPAKISGVSSASLLERQAQVTTKMQGGLDSRVSSQLVSDQTSTPASTLTALPSNEEVVAEEKAYQQAYHLIQNKDYDGALMAFKSMIKSFPHGKYVPNAHYWLGEIYLVKENLDLASEAFNAVYQNYLQHPKAADSLLKLGYVEYAKGQWKRSQNLLTQVKTQFPGTTSAQLADSRLQQMQQEGHP